MTINYLQSYSVLNSFSRFTTSDTFLKHLHYLRHLQPLQHLQDLQHYRDQRLVFIVERECCGLQPPVWSSVLSHCRAGERGVTIITPVSREKVDMSDLNSIVVSGELDKVMWLIVGPDFDWVNSKLVSGFDDSFILFNIFLEKLQSLIWSVS